MPSRKLAASIAIALGGGLLAVPAQQWPGLSQTNSAYEVSLAKGEMVGGPDGRQVQRVFLTAGTNKFGFVVPEGFRVDASKPQTIVLSDADFSCFITLKLLDPPAEAGKSEIEICRNLASNRFPGGAISDEFTEFAMNRSGPAFDLRWKNSGGMSQSARIAYVPAASGILELSLLTISDKFAENRGVFTSVLSSLCSNETGNLQIRPISPYP
jgi:hypothetical protein